jgi:hypothetical protein
MNLYDYLSAQVPNDCYIIMQKRVGNVPKPRNSRQMAMMLRKYVQTFGKDALQDLASIHPDRELISNQASFGLNPVAPTIPFDGGESSSSFGLNPVAPTIPFSGNECGCGGNCGKSNCGCKTIGKCNCGGNDNNFSNLIATPNSPQSYTDLNPQSKTHEVIISVGVVLLGLAVLLKVMK